MESRKGQKSQKERQEESEGRPQGDRRRDSRPEGGTGHRKEGQEDSEGSTDTKPDMDTAAATAHIRAIAPALVQRPGATDASQGAI